MGTRQKVILITVDSLRADHLNCLGYDKPTTPNIDALARKGVLFSKAFSNGGGSATSFPSIMTSTYASMNIPSNRHNAFWIKLSEKWSTIAEVLKHAGFYTAAFKNFKDDLCSIFGYNKGFDLFDEIIHLNDKTIDKMYRKIRYLQGYKYVRANKINQRAISWCNKTKENFFLWLHYMDVHLPYNPKNISLPNRIQTIKLVKKMQNEPDHLSQQEIEKVTDLYDAEIRYLDSRIGELLSKLMKIGIAPDETLFILLSDHGDQFMEHGEFGHGRLYDEVLHVPLILCGPDIKRNTVIQEQVSLLDVAPTITHLLGIETVETFCGTSLLPLVEGENGKTSHVISEEIGQDYSCRTQNWKYIRHDRSDTYELYNLQVDPKEKLNVLYEYPEIVEELDQILNQHIEMEKRVSKSIINERDFSEEEQESLKKVRLRNQHFASKVLGLPRHQSKEKPVLQNNQKEVGK